eukprot:m.374954 g.374954  ORF g.374954 m.374954 type:complete len:59 (-) comp20910_c0_seq10:1041-1217(-)
MICDGRLEHCCKTTLENGCDALERVYPLLFRTSVQAETLGCIPQYPMCTRWELRRDGQ